MKHRSMKSYGFVSFALSVTLFAVVSHANATSDASPYAGQEAREIKALSAKDVQDYLAGKGMGFAKAAELNGYPGPAHVLTLAEQLRLSAEQKQRTEALFRSMEANARRIGAAIVEEERKLDRAFASKSISPESLAVSLKRIGELQAQLRQVHLEAHLAQTRLLSAEQVTAYARLRGYHGAHHEMGHGAHRH